jgi:hypothetical protein
MRMKLRFALWGAAAVVAPWAGAEDSVLREREDVVPVEVTSSSATLAVATNSRGVPIPAGAREAAPAAKPVAAPSTSRPDSGSVLRSTITEVVHDTSHLVVTEDSAPTHYRFTKSTQFVDEDGRVLSADTLKSGTNATLYYTRTEGDLVLTKVIVNGTSRPLLGHHARALTELRLER